MLYYKDVITNKVRRTFLQPVAVTRDGMMNDEGLLLKHPRTGHELWIPHYLLLGASLRKFHCLKAQASREELT